MKIQAAVARAGTDRLAIESLDMEEPRPGEIVVRLVATGICHTDLKIRERGTPSPIVLGHEGAGIVEKIGPGVTKVRPGDHVTMSYDYCGTCPSCRENEPAYCHQGFAHNFGGKRPDGSSPLSKDGEFIHANFFGQSSFADFAMCSERNVVRVPKDLPLELLGPLGCGIQTGAGTVINGFKVGVGRTIAIFGTGSVGLSAVMAARLMGAGKIIAVDVKAPRLEMAKELGATHTIQAGDEDTLKAILKITGYGVDFALDTTGVVSVARQAFDSLAPRGTLGIIASSNTEKEIPVNIVQLLGGRKVRGIVQGESNPDVFIPTLIDLWRQGRFPFDRLVSFYPFERINDALHDSETGAAIKPVLRFAR